MESNQNEAGNSQNIVNQNDKFIYINATQNLNYLYPNGHRMTNQMRWFKGCQDKDIKGDVAA